MNPATRGLADNWFTQPGEGPCAVYYYGGLIEGSRQIGGVAHVNPNKIELIAQIGCELA
jgi:hypothetical protein